MIDIKRLPSNFLFVCVIFRQIGKVIFSFIFLLTALNPVISQNRKAEISDKVKKELIEKVFSITNFRDETDENNIIYLSNENLPANFTLTKIKNKKIRIELLTKKEIKEKLANELLFYKFEPFTVQNKIITVTLMKYWFNKNNMSFSGKGYECKAKGKNWKCVLYQLDSGSS